MEAKHAYNDYSKEQYTRRRFNMSYNENLDHLVQHLIQIQDADIAGQKDLEVYETYEDTNKDTNTHTNTISTVIADIVDTDAAEATTVNYDFLFPDMTMEILNHGQADF